MHAKVTVADDTVFVGSFNLSHSGEMNAENVLEIHDPALADRLAAYIDEVRERYAGIPALTVAPATEPVDDLVRVVGQPRAARGLGGDHALGQQPLAHPVDQPGPVARAQQHDREVRGSCPSG